MSEDFDSILEDVLGELASDAPAPGGDLRAEALVARNRRTRQRRAVVASALAVAALAAVVPVAQGFSSSAPELPGVVSTRTAAPPDDIDKRIEVLSSEPMPVPAEAMLSAADLDDAAPAAGAWKESPMSGDAWRQCSQVIGVQPLAAGARYFESELFDGHIASHRLAAQTQRWFYDDAAASAAYEAAVDAADSCSGVEGARRLGSRASTGSDHQTRVVEQAVTTLRGLQGWQSITVVRVGTRVSVVVIEGVGEGALGANPADSLESVIWARLADAPPPPGGVLAALAPGHSVTWRDAPLGAREWQTCGAAPESKSQAQGNRHLVSTTRNGELEGAVAMHWHAFYASELEAQSAFAAAVSSAKSCAMGNAQAEMVHGVDVSGVGDQAEHLVLELAAGTGGDSWQRVTLVRTGLHVGAVVVQGTGSADTQIASGESVARALAEVLAAQQTPPPAPKKGPPPTPR